MSIFFRAYGNTADTYISTPVNTVYATVRAATTSTAANVAAGSASIGQSFTGTNYTCRQAFLQFDTSSAPATGTVGLSMASASTGATTGGDFAEASEVSALTNKIAGASLSSLTQLGSLSMASFSADTLRVSISLTGTPTINAALKYVLSSRNERLNTAPTTLTEGCSIYLADSSGTTNDPYIQILAGTVWDHVSIGTSVEVTATTHTLIEPAGVAQGDLLVACIASRIASTTSITLPAGWTRVGEAKNNNVLATTSALASGMMAYIVRGASAPSFTFTHPAAPAPALGRVIAYRGVHPTTPLDTGVTQVTTATNTLAVSVAGLTTTVDDDLIVAMCAGGQEAAWSAFGATDPATNSGTTASSVLDPIWGQWLERADVQTTTSNDTSLAVFDAVKQTAGATGNLTATASLGAGHVVIAGSFKLALPTPTNFGDIIQSNTGTSTTATTTPTLPAATTAGSLLVLTFAADDYNATVSSGWTESSEMEQQTFHGGYLWWLAATAGMTIPSYTVATAVRSTWTLVEYMGPVGAGSYDGSQGTFQQTTADTITTDPLTPTSGTRLLVAGLQAQASTVEQFPWGAFTNSFAPVVQSLYNGGNPRLSIVQLRQVVTANGSTAYSTGGTESGGPLSRSAHIIAFKQGSSGTTYNETVAETAAAAETIVPLTESKARELENGVDLRETEAGSVRITEGDFFVAPPIDVDVVESASAAETVTAVLVYTKAVAETASAAETVTIALTYTKAVAETASAAETITGLLTVTAAIAETAAAVETTTPSIISAGGVFNETVVETAIAADTAGTVLAANGAIAEAGAAAEAITRTITAAVAIAETAAAADTVGYLLVKAGIIAETAAAAETVGGLLVGAGAVVETAVAADAVTKSVSVTSAIAETAAAADTVAILLGLAGDIAESTSVGRLTEAGDWREIEDGRLRGSAGIGETVGSLLISTAAVAESAAAVETITYSLTGAAGTVYNEIQLETATAVDAVGGLRVGTAAVVETAAATDTVGGLMVRLGAIAETATAVETINKSASITAAIAESTTESSGRQTEAGDWRETEDGKVRIATGVGDTVNGFLAAITVSVAESTTSFARQTEAGDWRETEDGKVRAAEGASDTVGSVLTSTVAVVESTASSFSRQTEAGDWRETEDGRLRGTAGTGETIGSLLTGGAAVVESASAAETITYSLTGVAGTTYNELQRETAAAADTVGGLLIRTVAVAETAAAIETITGTAGGVVPTTGLPNVWTGSAWVQKPVKVWTGSAWIQKPVKVWNGSTWTGA